MMNENDRNDQRGGRLPRDELDALLRVWHEQNADRAAAMRDRLLRAAAKDADEGGATIAMPTSKELGHPRTKNETNDAVPAGGAGRGDLLRRLVMNRYSRIAACLVASAGLIGFLMPSQRDEASAKTGIVQVPEGGRLDALDAEGNVRGPCALKHTDVHVEVSGHLTRVTVRQEYHNPYPDKIEAVYTFPLSHRAAVDRMTMTVGDRVIEGEVKERGRARAIYEAARQQGHVASLLEQERPNIFTQSVANIEPNAVVTIEISYVELLPSKDGLYTFDFPMVVGPRYMPGGPNTSTQELPAELKPRGGVVLLGPAKLTVQQAGETTALGTLQTGRLQALLQAAHPIVTPGAAWWNKALEAAKKANEKKEGDEKDAAAQAAAIASAGPKLWYAFEAAYPDGSKDAGALLTDGTGQIDGRWFYTDPEIIRKMGTGFAPNTTQVPDASRISPEPVKPGTRAGHDISVTVQIDTGGPAIVDLKSTLHEITTQYQRVNGVVRKASVTLKNADEIPNRDFVLSWRQDREGIQEATFAHTSEVGNFFTLILQPPERVADGQAVPRELVFVQDTSGSMRGFPIEKSKEVMTKERRRNNFPIYPTAGMAR